MNWKSWARQSKPVVSDIAQRAATKRQLQNAELESQQKLWRWLIVAALVMLLLETGLAGWLTRHPAVAAEK